MDGALECGEILSMDFTYISKQSNNFSAFDKALL